MAESITRAILHRDPERMRRYREYLDYYEGRRGSPPARLRERTLTFNYARAVVEKSASYLVTDHAPTVAPVDLLSGVRTDIAWAPALAAHLALTGGGAAAVAAT